MGPAALLPALALTAGAAVGIAAETPWRSLLWLLVPLVVVASIAWCWRHLLVTWEGKPSRFLDELGVRAAAAPLPKREKQQLDQTPAVQALREWRLARARADEVPAYVVFNDRTLAELVARTPRTLAELAAVPGIGPAKLERYGAELLARLVDVA